MPRDRVTMPTREKHWNSSIKTTVWNSHRYDWNHLSRKPLFCIPFHLQTNKSENVSGTPMYVSCCVQHRWSKSQLILLINTTAIQAAFQFGENTIKRLSLKLKIIPERLSGVQTVQAETSFVAQYFLVLSNSLIPVLF